MRKVPIRKHYKKWSSVLSAGSNQLKAWLEHWHTDLAPREILGNLKGVVEKQVLLQWAEERTFDKKVEILITENFSQSFLLAAGNDLVEMGTIIPEPFTEKSLLSQLIFLSLLVLLLNYFWYMWGSALFCPIGQFVCPYMSNRLY